MPGLFGGSRRSKPADPSAQGEAPGEDAESAERKVSAYQSLGVVSALLFGFSATVLYEITTAPADMSHPWALNAAIILAVVATVSSMLSTFVYVYHSYHVESLLSTRVRAGKPLLGRLVKRRARKGPHPRGHHMPLAEEHEGADAAPAASEPRPSPGTLAFRWIDATRSQRYVAQGGQALSASCLLTALVLVIQIADKAVEGPTAWVSTVIVVLGFVLTGGMLVQAQALRQKLRYGKGTDKGVAMV